MVDDTNSETRLLTIDAGALLRTAVVPIESTVQSVAFGLEAAILADPDTTKSIGQILQLGQEHADLSKTRFLEWVPKIAITALWQDFRLFLDQVAVVASLYGRQRDTSSEWDQSEVLRKAGKLPIDQLVTQIERDIDAELPGKLKADFLSLNKVRNCIEHRKGRVEEADRNIGESGDSPALEIRWNAAYAYITGNDERIPVSQVSELIIPPLGEMRIKLEPATRSWSLGELLVFSSSEIVEIGLSLVFSSQTLIKVLGEAATEAETESPAS